MFQRSNSIQIPSKSDFTTAFHPLSHVHPFSLILIEIFQILWPHGAAKDPPPQKSFPKSSSPATPSPPDGWNSDPLQKSLKRMGSNWLQSMKDQGCTSLESKHGRLISTRT
jgi:hypothetical protein